MELATRIERLCVELGRGELSGIVAEAGATPILDRLLRRVTADDQDSRAITADLDALEEALARVGIDGLTRGRRWYRPIPGLSAAPQYGWVCPQRCCSRAETDVPDDGLPVCAITGAALTRVRLTP